MSATTFAGLSDLASVLNMVLYTSGTVICIYTLLHVSAGLKVVVVAAVGAGPEQADNCS